VYCDELASVPSNFFFETVAPLFTAKNTVFIGITTSLGPDNYVSMLVESSKVEGVETFKVLQVTLVCNRCKDTPREFSCTHPVANRPAWKDEDAEEMLRVLYGKKREAQFRQEMMGQTASSERSVFGSRYIQRLSVGHVIEEPHSRVTKIYVAVDPNGMSDGSLSSESALIAFYYDGPRVVIIAIEHWPTVNMHELNYMVVSAITAIQSQPCFANATIILVPECNMAASAESMTDAVLRRTAAYVLCESRSKYGVMTTNNKVRYVERVVRLFEEDCIVYHHKVLSKYPLAHSSNKRGATESKTEFEGQLQRFQRLIVCSNDPDKPVKIKYSGRFDEEGKLSPHLKDDICMAFLVGVFHSGMARTTQGVYVLRSRNNKFVTMEEIERQRAN